MPHRNQEEFRTGEVCAAARVTPRMLQWWDERGVIMPRVEGHQRLYSQDQLFQVVALAALRRHRISLQTVRRYWRNIAVELFSRRHRLQSGGEVMILVNCKAAMVFDDDAMGVTRAMVDSASDWHLISMQRELNRKSKRRAA